MLEFVDIVQLLNCLGCSDDQGLKSGPFCRIAGQRLASKEFSLTRLSDFNGWIPEGNPKCSSTVCQPLW